MLWRQEPAGSAAHYVHIPSASETRLERVLAGHRGHLLQQIHLSEALCTRRTVSARPRAGLKPRRYGYKAPLRGLIPEPTPPPAVVRSAF